MNAAYMLLGALLAIAGVLVSALADRIRGIRAQRSREFWSEPVLERRARGPKSPRPEVAVDLSAKRQPIRTVRDPARERMESFVTDALTTSGFSKSEAAAAVAACTDTERQSLPEFTRAALQRAREAC